MKKLGGVLLVVLLGACDAAPERITAPEDARRGGFTYGSGNRSDNSVLLAPDTTVTLDVTTTETQCVEERGPGTYGGGHLIDPQCND